jgi:hypothetical protein
MPPHSAAMACAGRSRSPAVRAGLASTGSVVMHIRTDACIGRWDDGDAMPVLGRGEQAMRCPALNGDVRLDSGQAERRVEVARNRWSVSATISGYRGGWPISTTPCCPRPLVVLWRLSDATRAPSARLNDCRSWWHSDTLVGSSCHLADTRPAIPASCRECERSARAGSTSFEIFSWSRRRAIHQTLPEHAIGQQADQIR